MIKFILCQGIGFNPGSVKYLPTLGFVAGAAIVRHGPKFVARDPGRRWRAAEPGRRWRAAPP